MNNEGIIRVQKFRRFKKEIRGSKKYLIVGIDIAKDKHHAFMGNANGKSLLRRFLFKNDLDGFSSLLSRADTIKAQNGLSKVVFGLEPTSNYHKPLGTHLIRCDREVVVVSGVAVKRNRELLNGRWDKNDTKCAANIADLISQGKCLYFESPSPEISGIRDLLRLRERMVKGYHRYRMQIRNNLLAQYFPEFDQYFSNNQKESLSIVKHCLDPGKISGITYEEFKRTVIRQERGLSQEKRLRKIYELATGSIGCPVNSYTAFEAGMLADQMTHQKQLIQSIEDKIKIAASSFDEYHCLMTIPGFGPYISALVLAWIGDPFRFENHGQVLKLVGFDLGAKRSGKSSGKAVPVISKKGRNSLRYGLFQAAVVASARNEHFINYFTRILSGREKERGIKIKMRVKLAAKMLVIAWTLMKKKTCFDPRFLKT